MGLLRRSKNKNAKKGNRRLPNRTKNARSRRARLQRLGFVGRSMGVLVAVALVAGVLPIMVYTGYVKVLESGYFSPKDVTVEGNVELSEDEVIEAAGLLEGDSNLFEMETSEIEARLEQHAWVATAVVETELPDKVTIQVTERELLGLVFDDRMYLVDTEGEIIKPMSGTEHVPGAIISGFDGRLASGDERAKREVLEGFELAALYEAVGLERWAPLAEVHFDEDLGYTLFTGAEGTEVRLGFDRFSERLQRLYQVYVVLSREGVEAEYVLLDMHEALDRVAVKPRLSSVRGRASGDDSSLADPTQNEGE